ncbi:hypothetical protein CPB86DRAFT_743588 [Serendipita vermifera]|nr:hypothetical protein CPB86DRAFT_743588 [Serendipita vermifera]
MIFKGAIYTLALLFTSTLAVPQTGTCTNEACIAANNQYQSCLANYSSDLKPCLCTEEFLSNYDRCLGGTICPWPATVCVKIYCPGTFDGGFDAKEFCATSTA